eukprot:Nk52_evm6s303 gene=Nk52_evmTU6s303
MESLDEEGQVIKTQEGGEETEREGTGTNGRQSMLEGDMDNISIEDTAASPPPPPQHPAQPVETTTATEADEEVGERKEVGKVGRPTMNFDLGMGVDSPMLGALPTISLSSMNTPPIDGEERAESGEGRSDGFFMGTHEGAGGKKEGEDKEKEDEEDSFSDFRKVVGNTGSSPSFREKKGGESGGSTCVAFEWEGGSAHSNKDNKEHSGSTTSHHNTSFFENESTSAVFLSDPFEGDITMTHNSNVKLNKLNRVTSAENMVSSPSQSRKSGVEGSDGVSNVSHGSEQLQEDFYEREKARMHEDVNDNGSLAKDSGSFGLLNIFSRRGNSHASADNSISGSRENVSGPAADAQSGKGASASREEIKKVGGEKASGVSAGDKKGESSASNMGKGQQHGATSPAPGNGVVSPQSGVLSSVGSAGVSATYSISGDGTESDHWSPLDRPEGLPKKDPQEEYRQKREYERLLAAIRKKEEKEYEARRQQQILRDKNAANLIHQWEKNMIPNFRSKKGSRKMNDMAWAGIPSRVRGRVWELAIGNDLNITKELYDIFLMHAQNRLEEQRNFAASESANQGSGISGSPSTENARGPSSPNPKVLGREDSVQLIELDLSRTFPSLGVFQEGGPYHDQLKSVLQAYVCYRPDIGYVQGMSFIASMLLLNMEFMDAFKCIANLLNRPILIAFFSMKTELIQPYVGVFNSLLESELPDIHKKFQILGISSSLFLYEWFLTLFSKPLPLEVVSRVWDSYFLLGDIFLFRVALGILHMYQSDLLDKEFDVVAHFLTHLPQDMDDSKLFSSIQEIHITEKRFKSELQTHMEAAKQRI